MNRPFPLLAIWLVLMSSAAHAASVVPSVGCMTDGQVGPEPAPANGTKEVTVDSRAAAGLAWYFQSEMGVLAPRGWHCLALAGSNGTSLYVTPQPLSARMLDGSFKGIEGPAVQLSMNPGDTSGRFTAARRIARLFPQERKFVDAVIAEKLEPASAFPAGPYPDDKLTRRGANIVEYLTPKGITGLGYDSWLVKGDGPITGVVILLDGDHSVLSLAVRLPQELRNVAPGIVQQVEAVRLPLCDNIAARVRASPKEDAWSVLTKGGHPFINTRNESQSNELFGNARDDREVVSRYVARFNPSVELRKSWSDWIGMGHTEIGSLLGSDLHIVSSVSGSASCASFMFFQVLPGRQAQLLPTVPRKSDRDGDNQICFKYGGDAHLAWVDGVASFVETQANDNNFTLRVVPLRDGHWAQACAVDVAYRTNYVTSKAFLPGKSALTEKQLRIVAAQIVEQREAAKDAKDFSFGKLSGSGRDEVNKLINLLGNLENQPFPAFGREAELAAGEETLVYGDSFPISIGGRAYLLRIGTGQLGCCYLPGPLLILYTLKDGKPELAGSAIVEKRRGALRSARARASW